jgi:hypothetical protein
VRRALSALAGVALCGALVAAPASPQEKPLDEPAIRAKMREAEGALPKSYRETYVTKYSNGTTTTEHAYQRDKDYRSVYDSGPLHTEDGSLDGVLWRMNGNGQVVVDDLAPSDGDETDPDAPNVVVTRIRTSWGSAASSP